MLLKSARVVARRFKMSSVPEFPPEPVYSLVDIGANLAGKHFLTDLNDVITRAKHSGLEKIIVTGTSVHSSEESLKLAKQHPGFLYATAGVHPHDAKTFSEASLARLTEFANEPQCVAIGECGLDFNRNFSPQDDQRKAFDAQVELACSLRKPLFLHERDAATELQRILDKHRSNLPPVVVHCFTGTIADAKAYLDRGFYIGLTGFLWKDKLADGVQQALSQHVIPLNRLLLETDAPYMFPNVRAKKLPQPIVEKLSDRSKLFLSRHCSFERNEPCALPVICELIAAFMDVSAAEVAQRTTENAKRVFGLH